MPARDGTGPYGQGPMTGRGLGPCGGGMRKGFGRGFRMGYGRGYSNRCPVQVVLTEAEEKKILEAELEEIELEKKGIEKRLEELK